MDSFFSDNLERPNIYLTKFRQNIELQAPELVAHMVSRDDVAKILLRRKTRAVTLKFLLFSGYEHYMR